MAKNIRDYLTKQLLIEKNIVTFRSLSREFKIHVNQAKNELNDYCNNPEALGSTHATYLICGELSSERVHNDAMDVDEDIPSPFDDGEKAPEMRVTLAGEQDLETVRSTYARIFSEHIYCLSPSPVIDAGLICAPSDQVRATDATLKQDAAAALGRVIGPHVKKGKPIPQTALAKAKEPLSRKPTGPGLKTTKKPEEPPATEKSKEGDKSLKPKPSGTLDWSKAKSKQPAKTEDKEKPRAEDKLKDEVAQPKMKFGPPKKAAKDEKVKVGPPRGVVKDEKIEEKLPQEKPSKPAKIPEAKRGTKRKSALQLDSDSEDEDSMPAPREKTPEKQARPNQKKKLVVVSDDDDDEPIPAPKVARKTKAKPKPTLIDSDEDEIPSKVEMSLRAMMDIDDDDVIRVSHSRATSVPTSPEPETEPTIDDDIETKPDHSDGDVEMADSDIEVKPKQVRKRKEKKVIPVGKNGLKKRRVVKSRREKDEKGFTVTIDYSDYESVDEEEPEEEAPAKKPAAKGKKASKAADEPKEPRKTIRPGQPIKRSGSSAGSKGGQGSLMNFFGKK